jgi:hypothetical protein
MRIKFDVFGGDALELEQRVRGVLTDFGPHLGWSWDTKAEALDADAILWVGHITAESTADVTARPALDAWKAEVDDVLERAMPAAECVHDPDGWHPGSLYIAAPTPPVVEHDTPTGLRRLVGAALKPIKQATTWWGWDRL